jgi:hypothetical protein
MMAAKMVRSERHECDAKEVHVRNKTVVIPFIIIVIFALIILRATRRPPLSPSPAGIFKRDPIRLILLVAILLLVFGLMVSIFPPES